MLYPIVLFLDALRVIRLNKEERKGVFQVVLLEVLVILGLVSLIGGLVIFA